jgi:hypothetical protein
MEASTTKEVPDARLVEGPETAGDDRAVPASVEQAAHSNEGAKALTGEQHMDALDWLLQDDPTGGIEPTQTWTLNVGTDEQPRLIDWVIRPLDADTFTRLRAEARTGNRQQRRQRGRGTDEEANFDVTEFNLRMVATATVVPDLGEAARMRGMEAADPLLGPVELLKGQFRGKPGLLDQLAGYVMLFSGYDEQDVVRATPEITMVRAAGNS